MNRYINAGNLLTKIKAYRPYQYLGEDALSYAIKMVELEPTADVVEVVRCKDCKWWDNDGDAERCTHKYGGMWAKSDGYCSYGER